MAECSNGRLARDFEQAGEIVVGGAQPAELAGEVVVVGMEADGAAALVHALHLGLFVRNEINLE
jgi:hypothetical protein